MIIPQNCENCKNYRGVFTKYRKTGPRPAAAPSYFCFQRSRVGSSPPHIGPAGLRLRLAQGHQRNAVLHHLLHGTLLGERSVHPAPLAVCFVKGAVRLPGQEIVAQRHSAALAHQGPGAAQQCVDGHAEQPGQGQQRLRGRDGLSPLPAAHRLPGDKHLLRHLILGQLRLFPQIREHVFEFHVPHLLPPDYHAGPPL